MYRKIFSLLLAFALGPGLFAATQEQALSKALEQKAQNQQSLKMQHSANAHNKGVIPIKVTVNAYIDSDYVDNDPLVKECQAVRISSHYLLASMACVGLSGYGTIRHYAGAGGGPIKAKYKVSRSIMNVRIDGEVIDGKNIVSSTDEKVFLIRIDPANEKLKKIVQNKPAVNLFVAKNPQILKNLFSNVQINRERLCTPGRVCADVEISDVCTETGCFKLNWKMIRGDSGDPIFGLNPEKSTEEFLLGFNAADVAIDERQAGRDYYFFSDTLAQFLQKNIEKVSDLDWKQIKRKMVNEDYFLN